MIRPIEFDIYAMCECWEEWVAMNDGYEYDKFGAEIWELIGSPKGDLTEEFLEWEIITEQIRGISK